MGLKRIQERLSRKRPKDNSTSSKRISLIGSLLRNETNQQTRNIHNEKDTRKLETCTHKQNNTDLASTYHILIFEDNILNTFIQKS